MYCSFCILIKFMMQNMALITFNNISRNRGSTDTVRRRGKTLTYLICSLCLLYIKGSRCKFNIDYVAEHNASQNIISLPRPPNILYLSIQNEVIQDKQHSICSCSLNVFCKKVERSYRRVSLTLSSPKLGFGKT